MTYHGYARLGVGVTGSFYSAYFFSQAAENTVCFAFLTRYRGLSHAMRDLTMSLGKYQSTIPGPELVSGQIYTKNDKVETTTTVWISQQTQLQPANSHDDATVSFT